MKVCFLGWVPIATDPRVMRIAWALHENGHDIAAVEVCFHGDSPDLPPELNAEHIRIYPQQKAWGWLPTRWGIMERLGTWAFRLGLEQAAVWALYPFNYDLARAAWLLNADVYHAEDPPVLPAACWAADRTRAKVVMETGEFYTDVVDKSIYPAYRHGLHSSFEKTYVYRPDAVIVECGSSADAYANLYGIPRPVILRNVPRLAGTETYQRPPQPWDGRILRVLFHGRMQPRLRGLELVVEAAAYLNDRVQVTLRGPFLSESYGRELRNLIEERGFKRVVLEPPVPHDQLIQLARPFHVGIIPLITDVTLQFKYTLPNKLFEYMAAGLAVVATEGLVEVDGVVRHTQSGLTFRNRDPRHLAEILNYLAGHRSELMQMRTNAWRAVCEEYNWEREQQKVIALYESL